VRTPTTGYAVFFCAFRDASLRRADGAGGRFSKSPTLCRSAVLRSVGQPCLRSKSPNASSASSWKSCIRSLAGDTLTNDWDMLRETNPAKKPYFDAVVANPPFSYRWDPNEAVGEDVRFKNYGLAPKSAADFAFLLHGFHYLKDDGVMAIILPHGVLFRGGAEAKIRRKLLDDGHIDTVIGLPANLFYSTGIPVCILVLKKCKKPDDVLFVNASEDFEKGKRQNYLSDEHIEKIIDTYQQRPQSIERYARRVEMDEIKANDFNLNISRYVSTAVQEVAIDLSATHKELVEIEKRIRESTAKHNAFLKELGLFPLPASDK
jgi:type I restriction enzyme M protein